MVGGTTQAIPKISGVSTVENEYVVGSQTLKAGGPAITVSGTVVSLLSGGLSAVVGGTTTVAAAAVAGAKQTLVTETQATGQVSLGGVIASVGGFTGAGSGSGSGGGTGGINTKTTATSKSSPSGAVGTSGVVYNNGTVEFLGAAGWSKGNIEWYKMWGVLLGVMLAGIHML